MALTGEEINSHGILMGKPEGKRPLGSRRHSCDNIVMDIKAVGWHNVDWIGGKLLATVTPVMEVRLS